jgi:hypothetical protein
MSQMISPYCCGFYSRQRVPACGLCTVEHSRLFYVVYAQWSLAGFWHVVYAQWSAADYWHVVYAQWNTADYWHVVYAQWNAADY